jgi:hypothetical protein
MVNTFTVSRVKAVLVNKENDRIILIAIGNVLKNKYIYIANNIVCVFQMSIIMQIMSLYVITDKKIGDILSLIVRFSKKRNIKK